MEHPIAARGAVDGTLRIVRERQHVVAKYAPAIEKTHALAEVALLAAQPDFGNAVTETHLRKTDQNALAHFGGNVNLPLRLELPGLSAQPRLSGRARTEELERRLAPFELDHDL